MHFCFGSVAVSMFFFVVENFMLLLLTVAAAASAAVVVRHFLFCSDFHSISSVTHRLNYTFL